MAAHLIDPRVTAAWNFVQRIKDRAVGRQLQGGLEQLYQASGLLEEALYLLNEPPLDAFRHEPRWNNDSTACRKALSDIKAKIDMENRVQQRQWWRSMATLCWLGVGLVIASGFVELMDRGYLRWAGVTSKFYAQNVRLQELEKRDAEIQVHLLAQDTRLKLLEQAMRSIPPSDSLSGQSTCPSNSSTAEPFKYSSLFANNTTQETSGKNTPFSPCSNHKCAFWMDAADPTTYAISGGSTVSGWRSKSSDVVFTGSAIAFESSLNSLPLLRIPSDVPLTAKVKYDASLCTVFSLQVLPDAKYSSVVLNAESAVGIQFYSYEDSFELNGYGRYIFKTEEPNGLPIHGVASLIVGSITPGDAGIYVNGVASRMRNSPLNAFIPGETNGQKIGGNAQVDVAEIIVFDQPLSRADRQRIEGYLAWKWRIQYRLPDNHPYKTSPPAAEASRIEKVPIQCVTAVPDVDYPSNDYPGQPLDAADVAMCQQYCCESLTCQAYTYHDHHCWLKSKVSAVPTLSPGAISGAKPAPMTWSIRGILPSRDGEIMYDFTDAAASRTNQNVDLRLTLAVKNGGVSLSLNSQIGGHWHSSTKYATAELLATAPGYPVELKVLADSAGFRVVSALDQPIVFTDRLGVTSELYRYHRSLPTSFTVIRQSSVDGFVDIPLPSVSTGPLADSEVAASLFSGCYFNDATVLLRPGRYTPNILTSLDEFQLKDLRSVRVPPGYRVVLLQEGLQGGSSLTLTKDAPCLLGVSFPSEAAVPNNVQALVFEPYPTPTPWAPMSQVLSPQDRSIVRRNTAGEIECHGHDAINCDWTHSDADTGASLLAAGRQSNPLQCGARHAQVYSGDGYSSPTHWCAIGRRMFDSLSIEPFTPTAAGFDDSGTHICFANFSVEQSIAACRGRLDCSAVMWERSSNGEACLVLGAKATFKRSRKWIGYSKIDTSADNGERYPVEDYKE